MHLCGALDVTECQLWQDWDLASREVILRGDTRAGKVTDDFATLLSQTCGYSVFQMRGWEHLEKFCGFA